MLAKHFPSHHAASFLFLLSFIIFPITTFLAYLVCLHNTTSLSLMCFYSYLLIFSWALVSMITSHILFIYSLKQKEYGDDLYIHSPDCYDVRILLFTYLILYPSKIKSLSSSLDPINHTLQALTNRGLYYEQTDFNQCFC